jgi:Trypsin
VAVGALAGVMLVGVARPAVTVVGGTTIQIQQAPWTVFVQQDAGTSRYLCTGSIVDASHVLTAAHCVYDESGNLAQASALSVKAGVSNYSTPASTDAEQDRAVTSFRVHPGYVWTGKVSTDDVAVLALSTPLDLTGPAVQAIALPAAAAPFPAGTAVGVAGFGRETPTVGSSGPLAWMTGTVDSQGACGQFSPDDGLIADNAVLLCASSPQSAVCNGDSGSGLVTTTGTPVLVGVVSAGSVGCEPGTHSLYTYVGAPEILDFIQGSNTPPTAPRMTDASFLDLKWDPPLVAGNTVSCSSGGWSTPATLAYSFVNGANGEVLQSGSRTTFTIPAADVGANLFCEVAATSSGGTSLERTTATSAVGQPPKVRISRLLPLSGLRGKDVTVHVVLTSPAGLFGKFGVCAVPPAVVGGQVCRSVRNPDGSSGTFPFSLTFRIKPGAPAHSRIAINATAGLSTVKTTVLLKVSNP